nr:ROK family protein [Streptomyces sp. NBC_00974]
MPPTPGDGRAAANASAVLLAVLAHGPVARSGIPELCGLSPAAVSRQTTSLLRAGLLRELHELSGPPAPPASPTPGTPSPSGTPDGTPPGAAGTGGPGRPRIPLDLHTGPVGGPVVAGLHIGVPASTFSLVDLRGRVLARRAFPHAGHAPGRLTAAIAAELDLFLRALRSDGTGHTGRSDGTGGSGIRTRPLLGLGAALGGWVRPADGTVVRHDTLGWHDLPLAAELSDRLGLPVSVDNHARAVAHAEILFGCPEARSSLLHLFIGNVVDAAFGIGGTVHQGPGAAAGDVAHLPVPGSRTPCACGRTGCLQASASDTVLGAEAVRRGIVPEPSVNLLVDAAATGDPRADRLLRERARTVGRAAALLLDVFNPAVMVVSELSSVLDDGYLDEIREAAGDPERYGRRIVAPHAGPAVLPVAAATVLLGPLFRDPSRLT